MITLEYLHVDVFTRQAFQGNGLVVVLDAGLSPELMLVVTRSWENRPPSSVKPWD